MKMAKFLKAMIVAGVLAACVGSLAACSGSNEPTGGAAAATVNGTEIAEQTVTDQIQSVREQSSLTDEESWANFLIENEMTPESVRDQIIDSLVDEELVKAGAASLEISVDGSEIDTYVDQMKANFDDDEAWQNALKQAGFTEDEYRENIKSSLLKQKLNEHFSDEVKLSNAELLESAQTYASYYDGAKRSSHILFGVSDTSDEKAMKEARNKAKALLERINNGEVDFAQAAKENSTDTASAEKGGDVGWDVLNSFVTEYTDALDKLKKNQVSGLVESQYGIHIIKCTNVFNAPEKITKLSQLPKAFQKTIKDMAKSMKANEGYTKWLDKQREDAEIVKNDMPADAPYNVNLDQYKSDESASSASSASASSASASSASAKSEEPATADGDNPAGSDAAESDEAVVVEEENESNTTADNEAEAEVELEKASSSEAASSKAAA